MLSKALKISNLLQHELSRSDISSVRISKLSLKSNALKKSKSTEQPKPWRSDNVGARMSKLFML